MNALKNIKIELTSKCTCACFKCPRTILKGLYDELELPVEHVKKVLDLTPRRIYFMGNLGDPIYHTRFPEIISMTNEYNTPFNVHTVGSGYDENWWRNVYNAYDNDQSNWVFTLDGLRFTAGKYRVGLVYDETFTAMRLGAELGKNITWQFIVLRHNQHDIEEAKRLADEHGINIRIDFNERWDGNDDPWKPTISKKDIDLTH